MMVTRERMKYRVANYGTVGDIPKGIEVMEATNLPPVVLPNGGLQVGQRYWVGPWEGMSVEEDSWRRNYGFLLDADEVEEVEEAPKTVENTADNRDLLIEKIVGTRDTASLNRFGNWLKLERDFAGMSQEEFQTLWDKTFGG